MKAKFTVKLKTISDQKKWLKQAVKDFLYFYKNDELGENTDETIIIYYKNGDEDFINQIDYDGHKVKMTGIKNILYIGSDARENFYGKLFVH